MATHTGCQRVHLSQAKDIHLSASGHHPCSVLHGHSRPDELPLNAHQHCRSRSPQLEQSEVTPRTRSLLYQEGLHLHSFPRLHPLAAYHTAFPYRPHLHFLPGGCPPWQPFKSGAALTPCCKEIATGQTCVQAFFTNGVYKEVARNRAGPPANGPIPVNLPPYTSRLGKREQSTQRIGDSP